MRRELLIIVVLTGLMCRGPELWAQGFGGGVADGYACALSSAPSQFTPTGYYDGGSGDGFSTGLSANFTYSANRFGGGGYDGYARGLSPDNSFSLTRYYGGEGDGYTSAASLLIKNQPSSTLPLPGAGSDDDHILPETATVFRVWPNPFSEVLNIALQLPPSDGAWISLHDITGRELERFPYEGDSPLSIDAAKLPAGAYLLSVLWWSDGQLHREQHRIVRSR